jgi:hypothetical protein
MYLCKSSEIVHESVAVALKRLQQFQQLLGAQRSQSLQQPPMEWALLVKERALQLSHQPLLLSPLS